MGFLKRFRKKGSESPHTNNDLGSAPTMDENMDLPPAPPGFDQNFSEGGFDDFDAPPEPPGMGNSMDTPLNEIPDMGQNDFSDSDKDSLPDFPKFDSQESQDQQSFAQPNASSGQNQQMTEQEIINKVSANKPDFPRYQSEPTSPMNDHSDDMDYDMTRHIDNDGPLFIMSSEFQRVLGRIKSLKATLKETHNVQLQMNSIRIKEDKQFKSWKTKLEDIQRKLIYVDKKIFNDD